MKNLLYFKKIFLLLLLSAFALPVGLKAQTNQLGRLWEYIYDPSNPAFTAQKNEVVNFMKENFDSINIPLISIAKLKQNNGRLYGIDSIYKHSDAYAIGRWKTWYNYFHEWRKWPYPWFNYRGYPMAEEAGKEATELLTPSGPSFNRAILDGIKQTWDKLEGGNIPALMPIITLTSEIKDGYITGIIEYTAATNLTGGLENFPFVFNVILAEGYHKYGSEEHYFIPRTAGYLSSAPIATLGDLAGKKTGATFSFPIDKSWNTKYLYVIGILELYPYYPGQVVTRLMLDAAVDKPVDVRNAPQHTPLQLNVSHNPPTQQFHKIMQSSSTDIVFKVENPTSAPVTAEVYIDSTTSSFGNGSKWTITRSASTITVPANSSTNVTITAQAPAEPSVAAFDLAIRPINTANNVNPIISNALTVISTDGIRILGLAKQDIKEDELNLVQYPFFSNTYFYETAVIPLQYYSSVDIFQFEAYVLLAGNSYRHAMYPNLGNANLATSTLYQSLNANTGADIQTEIVMNNVLTEAQAKFLNDIIASGKHLALFTDRTGIYSTLASEKTELQKLFTNLGVSFKDETYRLVAHNIGIDMPKEFNVIGTSDEQLSQNLDISFNSVDEACVAYTANWNITSTSTTSKVFSYSDIANSVAAVKTTRGNSKLFLAGFGLEGASRAELMEGDCGEFFENLTTWWFGEKVEPKPTISIDQTSLDFGTQMVSTSKDLSIVITNTATDPNDVLSISNASSFKNTVDNSFSIVDFPLRIAAGQKDTLVLRFTPQNIRDYTNITFSLMSDATNTPEISIPCVGTGIENTNPNPVFGISDDMLEHTFADKAVDPTGNTTENFEIWFTNSGAAPLVISTIKFSANTDTEIYTLAQEYTTPITVNKNDYGNIIVQFSALKSGTFDGVLEIHSNDPDRPIVEVKLHAHVATGIKEQIAEMFNCTVAPVPANDLLTIEFNILGNMPRNVKLNIIDQTGKTLSVVSNDVYIPNSYKQTVDVQFLPAGSYFLEYTIDNMRASVPFSIAR